MRSELDDAVAEDEREAIAALVRDLGESGREITDEELRRLRTYLATHALMRSTMARADDELGGIPWEGQTLKGGDRIPRLDAKYLKHVVVSREWPERTTLIEDTQSLANAILDSSGGVFLKRDEGDWHLEFVARSRRSRGPNGAAYILVGFVATKGLWLTGFQPPGGLRYVTKDQMWTGGRWVTTHLPMSVRLHHSKGEPASRTG